MRQRYGASREAPVTAGRPARRALDRVARRLRMGEDGLTLVEVLVAVTILTFGLLALASVSLASMLSLRDTRMRQRATETAALVLDAARTLDYDTLANRTGDPVVTATTFDPDGTSDCLGAETVLYAAGGPVADGDFVSGPSSPSHTVLQVRTYVTQADALDCDAGALVTPAKRVTVVVAWKSGPGADAAVRELRKSTVIALSERGNGTPEFSVSPVVGSSTGPIGRHCIAATLTNQGMTDAYEIVVTPPTGLSLTMYRDDDGDNVGDLGEELDIVGGIARTDGVATGGSMPLLFCYDATLPSQTSTARPRVRSFYLQTLEVELTHTVVTTATLPLWLHTGERNDQDENRAILDPNPPERDLPAFVLSRDEPATTPDLFNDDADVDAWPGLWLPRVAGPQPPDGDGNDLTSAWHGRWDYQLSQNLTLEGAGQISLWTSTPSALGPPQTDPITGLPLPPPASTVAVKWRILRVNAEHDVVAVLAEGSDSYVQALYGWTPRVVPFTLLSPTTMGANEWLRLELVCDAASSTEDCHVATDTPTYSASVEVPLT